MIALLRMFIGKLLKNFRYIEQIPEKIMLMTYLTKFAKNTPKQPIGYKYRDII